MYHVVITVIRTAVVQTRKKGREEKERRNLAGIFFYNEMSERDTVTRPMTQLTIIIIITQK